MVEEEEAVVDIGHWNSPGTLDTGDGEVAGAEGIQNTQASDNLRKEAAERMGPPVEEEDTEILALGEKSAMNIRKL